MEHISGAGYFLMAMAILNDRNGRFDIAVRL